MAERSADAAIQAPEPRGLIGAALGLIVAGVLLFPIRRRLQRFGQGLSARGAELGGFTRAAVAVWIAVVDTAVPAFAANLFRFGLKWGGLLSPTADTMAGALVGAVAWSAAILALGHAFTSVLDPDWRTNDSKAPHARRVRVSLWAVAVVTSTGFVLRQFNYAVGASVAATIASNCILSLAYAAAAALILIAFGRGTAAKVAQGADSGTEAARSPVWTLTSLALTLAIVVTVASVLSGYTTLASLISGQIFWLSLIAAATFLLLQFIDEGFGAVFRQGGRTTLALSSLFGLKSSTVLQVGLLASAMLQLLVLAAAVTLALTPFGQSGERLWSHIGSFANALQIGKVKISPVAFAAGLGVFAVGLGVVHLVRHWVVRRYLPVTGWDPGLRNSVSTGVSYLGVGVTLICAFTAMGLGFQQIALIAGALSVGIGFGLQQIVQNFVSGIILLIERPIEVGDWIDLGGGIEGDVRQIRVRATEITSFDRSTVIVPNSNLITQNVRNRTMGGPLGRVELKLTIAKAVDVSRAREIILDAATANDAILKTPAPAVYVDSLTTLGGVTLTGYAYVADPRSAYGVRSDIYLDVLARCDQQAIALGG
jgi:small-conductance mechanosensitive channel